MSYVFGHHYWLEGDIIDEVFFIKGFGAATGNRNGLNFFYSSNSPAFDYLEKRHFNILRAKSTNYTLRIKILVSLSVMTHTV
jgi:hypothetical protein